MPDSCRHDPLHAKGPTVLTFVIPVRHPSSIADPTLARSLMAETLASLAAQTHPDWRCVIAAERDADLPDLPPGVEVVETDIPAPDLPHLAEDKHTNREMIRQDKGRRIMTALVAVQPRGHVMVVDYDDLVSRRLAALSAERPDAAGWYFDSGWLYSGGAVVSAYPQGFNRFCGTSVIVHRRLLRIPETMADYEPDYTARTLGGHIFVRQDLADAGTPLEPLPFPGAVYRIGHVHSASLSDTLWGRIVNRQTIRAPAEIVRNLGRLRPLGRSLRREFFGARG